MKGLSYVYRTKDCETCRFRAIDEKVHPEDKFNEVCTWGQKKFIGVSSRPPRHCAKLKQVSPREDGRC